MVFTKKFVRAPIMAVQHGMQDRIPAGLDQRGQTGVTSTEAAAGGSTSAKLLVPTRQAGSPALPS